MPTETYSDLMRRAWGIVRSNRAIWWLALIAVFCGRIGGGGGGGNVNLPNNTGSLGDDIPNLDNVIPSIPQIGTIIAIAVIVSIVIVLLSILFWVIGCRAIAGLIHAAASADHGEPLSFGEAWRRGGPALWRLIKMDILLALPVFALLLIMGGIGALVFARAFAGGSDSPSSEALAQALPLLFCLLPFLLILVLYGVVVRLLQEYTSRAVVLEGLGARASVRRGWQVFRSAAGRGLGTWLLGGALFFAVGLVLVVPLLIIFGVTIAAFLSSGEPSVAGIAVAGIAVLVLLLVGFVLTAVVGAFMSVLWTLIYGRSPAVVGAQAAPVTTPLA